MQITFVFERRKCIKFFFRNMQQLHVEGVPQHIHWNEFGSWRSYVPICFHTLFLRKLLTTKYLLIWYISDYYFIHSSSYLEFAFAKSVCWFLLFSENFVKPILKSRSKKKAKAIYLLDTVQFPSRIWILKSFFCLPTTEEENGKGRNQ